ncbi:MAG TPA: diacylglycerol kinase family protein [Planctomycetota bacterium]
MHVAILVNPNSGRGTGPERARRLEALLTARGHQVELHLGASREDAVDWARKAQADRLVVVGGDGSLNAVLDGLPADCPPLALIPLGTSNLLGAEWRLPRKEEAVADLVETGVVRELDVGQVNQRRTCLVWDFGLGGELMRRMEEGRDGPIKKAQYFPHLCRMMRDWTPRPQRVIADGEDLGEFDYGIVAGVSRYASKVLRLGPGEPADGLWELYLLPEVGYRSGIWFALQALLGRVHKCSNVVVRKVRRVEVRGERPSPIQIDGDFAGHTPVEFELTGFRLPVLVPARRSPRG